MRARNVYNRTIRQAKQEAWFSQAVKDESEDPWGRVYKILRGKMKSGLMVSSLRKPDGSYTSNEQETLQLMLDVKKFLFSRFAKRNPVPWLREPKPKAFEMAAVDEGRILIIGQLYSPTMQRRVVVDEDLCTLWNVHMFNNDTFENSNIGILNAARLRGEEGAIVAR